MRVGIASSSPIAAEAGARIADEGGNAVDAAIAAAIVSLTTEPGVCSAGAGGFVTVWPPGQRPVTIDGNIVMPGRGLAPERLGKGATHVNMAYGGGIDTCVGYGSVGVPGALAALGVASERFGRAPWRLLVEPAWEWARDGFPLSQPSHDYLVHAHEKVYGWHPLSHAALHDERGALLGRGELVRVADLADSLERIATHGADDFYRGELARLIANDSEANEGMLTLRDLNEYEAQLRQPLDAVIADWHLASNPPPAVGGVTFTAMLQSVLARPFDGWDADEVAFLARVQAAVLTFRREHLDLSDTLAEDAQRLLAKSSSGELARELDAPSTVHTSAVSGDGLGCAITMSAGYGSGVIPPGTGIWMNNCLGELELNRRGLVAGPPGTPLASNMAPTVARRADGAVLAIGSPGASRITTALLMTLVSHLKLGMTLGEAVRQPRLHVEVTEAGVRAAYEAGLDASKLDMPSRRFDELSMFFGGVGATLWAPGSGIVVAADPRRTGGEATGGRDT